MIDFQMIANGTVLTVAVGSACAYWILYAGGDVVSWPRSVLKTLTLAPLAVLFSWQTLTFGAGPWPIALGLCLGVLGDFFLSRPGQTAFLAGMAAFGAGHLAYVGGMLARSAQLGFDGIEIGEGLCLAGLALLVLSTEVWLTPHAGALRWPVRAYAVVIALMGAAAIALPENPGGTVLRLGAMLFILSDLLLAIRLFIAIRPKLRRVLGLTLWPAYVAGQVLILYGASLFWTFPTA